MSLPTDILLKKRGSDADIVCGSDDASIYDIKNSLDQTEAVKTAATDGERGRR